DTANESILLFGVDSPSPSITNYCRPAGYGPRSSEIEVRCVCPTSGIIKNLYVQLSQDPGVAPDAYTITLRLNGATVAQSSIVTIVADDRTGNDVAHNLAVVASDVLTVMITPTGDPDILGVAMGLTFVAAIDGESLILGGSFNPYDNTATEYNHLTGTVESPWTVTEAERYQLAQKCTLKKLYVLLDAAPGAGNKFTFTVRKNAASPSGGLVVEIADAATTGNDTTNTITVVNDDELDLMCVPTNTPTGGRAYWGLVGSPPPPYTPENKSANMGSKMVAAELVATTEAPTQCLTRMAFVAKNFFVNVQANDTNGTRIVNARKNGGDGNLSVSIGAAATGFFEDLGNSDTLIATDLYNYKLGTGGTSGDIALGAVGFEQEQPAPPVGIENKSANMGSKMVAANLI
ncbi:unnamed protein product, partial [marine sediment metagenome]